MMKNEDNLKKVSLGSLLHVLFDVPIAVIKNCPKICVICHGQEDQPSHRTKKSVRLVPVRVAIY
jgi:hypothetical protein